MILSINKNTTGETGNPISYHVVTKIEVSDTGDALLVYMSSWKDEQSYIQKHNPVELYFDRIPLQALSTSSNFLLDVGSVLTSRTWLAGGTVFTDAATDLQAAKNRKWNTIKIERDKKEFMGFVWDNSIFDSDPQSQSRIQGGVQLAQIAQQASQPFSINWTLQNNTVRVLNAQEMIAVGMALATHVQDVHDTGRILRTQIEDATTIEQVEAIEWPV